MVSELMLLSSTGCLMVDSRPLISLRHVSGSRLICAVSFVRISVRSCVKSTLHLSSVSLVAAPKTEIGEIGRGRKLTDAIVETN
jgi:hypothetical protein